MHRRWNDDVYEAIYKRIRKWATGSGEMRAISGSCRVFTGRDNVHVGSLDDPTRDSMVAEKQTLSRINSCLGLSEEPQISPEPNTSRVPPEAWSRIRLNGTLTGLRIRVENLSSVPHSSKGFSAETPGRRGRRHVSLHPIYDRNPIVSS